MSKMKKLLAMFLTLAMVLGMSMTTLADNKKPEVTDTAAITVSGVEATAKVYAYQIAKANYDDAGLTGYSKVDATDVIDIYNPTAAEVTALAQKYRLQTGTELPYNATSKVHTKDGLAAGLYLILVKDAGTTVYNPMIVSLAYLTEGTNISGSWNELQPGSISAGTDYTFDDQKIYAKSSTITFDKVITTEGKKSAYADDAAIGDTASFKITTETPDYSDEYTTATFTITDVMDASLDLQADTIVVTAGTAVKGTDYTVESADHGFTVTFTPAWVLAHPAVDVTITYDAILNATASTGLEPNDNTATLTYTSEPNVDPKTVTAATKHYTFATNGEILKVDEQTPAQPLAGATFTLTNNATQKVYTSISADETGKIEFTGLDEGTYTLVETAAPDGYTINETEYTVVVSTAYDKDGKVLTSFDITINDAQEVKIPNTKIAGLPSTGGIGTTIFTIAGCGIMIAAAYLFFVSRRKEA